MDDSMQTGYLLTFAKHPTHRWGHQQTFFSGYINIARFVSGKINDEFFLLLLFKFKKNERGML